MAKLTPEQLKQIRLNNLSKGRLGKGRPKGAKNKITQKKIYNMIEKFLEQTGQTNTSEIVKNELKLDIKEKINNEVEKNPQIELPIQEQIIDNEIKETVIKKSGEQMQDIKQSKKEVKQDIKEKQEEKPPDNDIFGFEF